MIFVDTWAWVALADKRDPYHRKAKAQHRKLLRARRRYVTTDNIMGEAITYLYDAIGSSRAQRFISSVLAGADSGMYLLVHISPPAIPPGLADASEVPRQTRHFLR